MRFTGKNGSLIIDSDNEVLVIERRSNTMNRFLGRRTIPLSEIQSVTYQPQQGIYLGVLGVIPRGAPPQVRRGMGGRMHEVNADTNVTFTAKQQDEAKRFASYLEKVGVLNTLRRD